MSPSTQPVPEEGGLTDAGDDLVSLEDEDTRALNGVLDGGVLEDAEVPTQDQALDLDDEAELAAAYALTEGHEDGDILSDDLSDLDARRIAELSESASPSDDPVRMYLKEIGQVRLLDNQQEIWLAIQMSAAGYLEQMRENLKEQYEQSGAPHADELG